MSNSLVLSACAGLTLVKLWLVQGSEIVARFQPYDDLWYVTAARHWYWFTPYALGQFRTPPFVRPPAYPLFIALASLTGMPLRISIELCLAIGAFVFARSLVVAGEPRALGVLVFAFLIFQPASFFVNNYAGTDSFYAPVLLLTVGLMIVLLEKSRADLRWTDGLAAGLALAILWHVRQEREVVLSFVVLCAMIALATLRLVHQYPWPICVRRLLIVIGVPSIAIGAASVTVKAVNRAAFGVFATDAMSTSDFKAVSRAILRIRPDRYVRYVPVTHTMLLQAYRVSPAFRELEPYFEGGPGLAWAALRLSGEIRIGIGVWHQEWP